jgi:sulfatase modifying factor 1
MKKTPYLLLLVCFFLTLKLGAQSPNFCADMLDKAKVALKNRDYSRSRDYCEAILPLCPEYTDRLTKVLEEVNLAIEGEKRKANEEEEKAKAALKQLGIEKAEADLLRQKAEESARIAQEKTIEAEKQAEKARLALLELQKALYEIALRTVRDAQNQIYHLDYEEALVTLKSAAALNVAQEEIGDAMLEIAFFYAETGHFDRINGVLDTAARLIGKNLTGSRPLNSTESARKAIQTLNSDLLALLDARYFPIMLEIPGGTYVLGSESGDEGPRHSVNLSAYKMAKTETTYWQYNLFCEAKKIPKPERPGWGFDGDNPVVNVSWKEAIEYTKWLNEHEKPEKAKSGPTTSGINLWQEGFRLPTEAEWEFAARANSDSTYAGGNDLSTVAWYGNNSGNRTQPVAKKKPNAYGLYDMSGNVWEWCWDWYSKEYFTKIVATQEANPRGPEKGSNRVLHGGSWFNLSYGCRVSSRTNIDPRDVYNYNGFRVAKGN